MHFGIDPARLPGNTDKITINTVQGNQDSRQHHGHKEDLKPAALGEAAGQSQDNSPAQAVEDKLPQAVAQGNGTYPTQKEEAQENIHKGIGRHPQLQFPVQEDPQEKGAQHQGQEHGISQIGQKGQCKGYQKEAEEVIAGQHNHSPQDQEQLCHLQGGKI